MKIKDIMLYLPRGVVSTLAKQYRTDLDDTVKDKIIEEGMYHFTDEESALKIQESEYLKPASGFMKYINSYGTPVACLFCGKPDIDNYVKNVTATKTEKNPYINPAMIATAIKVSPTNKEELKNYKIRNMSDSAVLYEGYCVLPHEKIQVVKMVPDLVRDEENTPIMDKNGEFKIAFREARPGEIIGENNEYLAQKDYLDYIKQKSLELGYSKKTNTIAGKINNYANNIIDQGRMEQDVTKENVKQNLVGNFKALVDRISNMLKRISTPKLDDSFENKLENSKLDGNSPYKSKKIGQFIAKMQTKKGIEQIDIKDGLNLLKEDNLNQFIKNKYNKLQENISSRRGIHGEEHSKRVVLNAMMIAKKENIFYGWDNDNRAKDILITAAAFHDIGRIGNNGPHAKRSARKVGKMDLKFSDGTSYSEQDKKVLMAIIESHEGNKEKIFDMLEKYDITDKESIDIVRKLSVILRDADALDRPRLDVTMLGQTRANLNPEYLITNSAISMIEQSYALVNITKNKNISMDEILSIQENKPKTNGQKYAESLIFNGKIDHEKAIKQTYDAQKRDINSPEFELYNE